ncbi:MAG TPA: 4'-phosphopantetheinyl transferase superfamily protein [Staphylococcus sp.]|nr:4'-phosphopantetheinyl transferase superfamily protein [Staphylococcus sp.]
MLYLINVHDLDFEDMQNKFLSKTSTEKREKIERLYAENDKLLTLMGELLLYYVLIKDYKLTPKIITFEKNKFGKPFLLNSQNLYFNLSHSHDWVACYVSDTPVGVDIEKIDDIAHELFWDITHPKEQASLINNQDNFFSIWCLKESFIKFKGQGLYLDIQKLCFDIRHTHHIKMTYNHQLFTDYFFLLDIIDNYKIALCCENITEPKIKFVTYNAIEKLLYDLL